MGIPVLEPQSSIYSRRRRSSILDCSQMENRKNQYHNWKRNRSTKPPWKNWNIVESLLRSLSSCVGPLWCLREYLLPLRVQLCHIYGGLALWECQRAFILLLLKHEVCHHCSDLFPSERIVPADLDKHRKSVFPIQNHFRGNQIEDLYSSKEHWIQTGVSRIRGAGYLICKWDWKILADFINSAVLCWAHLK